MDPSFHCAVSFDGLEIYCQIVHEAEEPGSEEESKGHGTDDVTIEEEAWGKCPFVAKLDLRIDEDRYEKSEADK